MEDIRRRMGGRYMVDMLVMQLMLNILLTLMRGESTAKAISLPNTTVPNTTREPPSTRLPRLTTP
jgi:hypothetical protein